VRIGVFALTTPDDPSTPSGPLALMGRGDAAWVRSLAFETATALRTQGAQVVILLSRLGRTADEAIAAQQPGPLIDLVVEGLGDDVLHEPLVVAGSAGHTTRIVAAGARYEHVGRLRLTVDGPFVAVDEYSLLSVGPWIEPEPAVQALLSMLQRRIVAASGEDVYGSVIGRALRDVDGHVDPTKRARDSALGNLVTNAYRWKGRSEIGLTANGYLGEGLYRGPLVGADLFRVVGHAYDGATKKAPPLVKLAVKGAELLKGIEGALAYLGRSDSLFLQFSGLRYRYDSGKPEGQRIVPGSVLVHGEPIDAARVYSLATGTALAAVLKREIGIEVEGSSELRATEYESLRDYVRRSGVVAARSEGRIQDVAR
jgi:5'-nucleotidase